MQDTETKTEKPSFKDAIFNTLTDIRTASFAQSDNTPSWFENMVTGVRSLIKKTGELIEEPVNIPLSEESINGLVDRYVTQKVKYFDHLSAQLNDDDFDLTCDIEVKGIKANLSGRFEVVTFEFDDAKQHMVFRQKTPTQINHMFFDTLKTKLMATLGLFYIRRILRKDPLAFALDYFKVATVDEEAGDTYDFDIGRYFKEGSSVIKNLKRFQVSHAYINQHKLYVRSGVNIDGFFDRKPLISEDDMPEAQSSVLVFDERQQHISQTNASQADKPETDAAVASEKH